MRLRPLDRFRPLFDDSRFPSYWQLFAWLAENDALLFCRNSRELVTHRVYLDGQPVQLDSRV